MQESSAMSVRELIQYLRTLDILYIRQTSFRAWLDGETTDRTTYESIIARIEAAFPGLRVVRVDITYKETHALVTSD